MIIDLRGSSGSGKSYPVYRLLDAYRDSIEELYLPWPWAKTDGTHKLVGYRLPGDLAILGPYTAKNTGGLDSVKTMDMRMHVLKTFIPQFRHAIYEALIVSSSLGRFVELGQWVEENAPRTGPMCFGFLDTPLDVCIARVYHRNGGKPIKEETIAAAHKRMISVRRNLQAAGFWAPVIDHTRQYEQVTDILSRAGWRP